MTDHNLLFAIQALQWHFISRDALIEAMNAWAPQRHRTLSEVFVERGMIHGERARMLEALIHDHVDEHGSPQASLAAMELSSDVRVSLAVVVKQVEQPQLREELLVTTNAALAHTGSLAATIAVDGAEQFANAGFARGDAGRFRILKPHAKGGLGEVFLAEDTQLGRKVALKEIQARHADDKISRARFLLEAEITGGLEHPNIVPVHALGTYEDGRPYYAMRFIRGDSLKDAISEFYRSEFASAAARTLAFRGLVKRFVDVCNAVAYAHSRGVLHRDLKPGNIMLGKYGETLVVDWGLAKAHTCDDPTRQADDLEDATLLPPSGSGSVETVVGSALGTPMFMSPEQASGRLDQLGPASDVYSLGATLYVLLTGKMPFPTDIALPVLLSKVERGEVLSPAVHRWDIPPALSAVCLKAMATAPADRYPTATALAADLEQYLADEPVSAHRETLVDRTRRAIRKRPATVAALAATLVVGMMGLALGTYLVGEKNRELFRAENLARKEAATAVAIKNFLQHDLLQFASPNAQSENREDDLKIDPDLKVRDLVFRAAKLIDGKFPNDPLVEAELRGVLGSTLKECGFASQAAAIQEIQKQIYVKQYGPDHRETLRSMMSLADSYAAMGRKRDALLLREEALRRRREVLGPNDPDTLQSMSKLASSYYQLGRQQEALALDEKTVELQTITLGVDHPHTLISMNNLAISYFVVGRYKDALDLRLETLRLQKAKLGLHHPDTLRSMNNLANSYDSLGQVKAALATREETLQLRKAMVGPDHPDTLLSMNNLAKSYHDMGELGKALALRQEALRLRKAKFGPDHPNTLASIQSLAASYRGLGRHSEAIKLLEEILRIRKSKLGPDHPDTLTSTFKLANSYADLGRLQEAIELQEEALGLHKSKLGPGHPRTLNCMWSLAAMYAYVQQNNKALELLTVELLLRERIEGMGNSGAIDVLGFIAELAYIIGDHKQARKAINRAMTEQVKTIQRDPEDREGRSNYAHYLSLDGKIHLLAGKYNEAANSMAKIQFLFADLQKKEKLTDEQLVLATEVTGFRSIASKAERAVADLKFLLRQEKEEIPELLRVRGYALKTDEALSELVATAHAWESVVKNDPTSAYRAAECWCHALSVTEKPEEKQQFADQAVGMLRRVKIGTKEKQTPALHLVNLIRDDLSFAPLRDRPEFTAWYGPMKKYVAWQGLAVFPPTVGW